MKKLKPDFRKPPTIQSAIELTSEEEAQVVDRFIRIWYEKYQRQTWRENYWRGVRSQNCPLDLWVLQEIIFDTRASIVIEVGVKYGGTTLFLADCLEMLWPDDANAKVVGIDLSIAKVAEQAKRHQRIELLEGDSTDPGLHAHLNDLIGGKNTLVVLDSDHHADHVFQELTVFEKHVPIGCYIVVGDTIINGHPALPGWGDGPFEAVRRFLCQSTTFVVDHDREKHLLTLCRNGYLRRLA